MKTDCQLKDIGVLHSFESLTAQSV